MPPRNNISIGIVALLILIGSGFWYWQKYETVTPENQGVPSYQHQPEKVPPQKEGVQNGKVEIIMRSVGPLESDNTYPEIQPNQNVKEEIRNTVNATFKDQAISSSCIYGEGSTKDFLVETLQQHAETRKALSQVNLQKMTLDEVRKLYIQIMKPYTRMGYEILFNKNNILAGTYSASGSYCGWEAHPSHSVSHFIIDLNTGKDITLDDIVTVDSRFLSFVKEKIKKEYIAGGSTNSDNACWQYIHDEYLISYDNDNEDFGITTLNQEKSLGIGTGTLSIIPTGYSSIIEGLCNDTAIILSYPELAPYLKKGNLFVKNPIGLL